MGKIFCLMGKSGSGKDTVFKHLMEDRTLNLKPFVGYTTRPKRINETEGIEYHFINEALLEEYKSLGKIIEQRVYDTVYGKWHYCTVDDGQIKLEEDNYLLIVTLEAFKSLKTYFGQDAVIPLYITLDDGIRLERALKRERQQDNPNYDELCRRFLADQIDFSQEVLDACGIKKYYINEVLDTCVREIRNYILNYEACNKS